MKQFLFFCIVLGFLASCGSSKNAGNKNAKKDKTKPKEESLLEQAKDDAAFLSKSGATYLETFHKAVRFKIAGNYTNAILEFENCLKQNPKDDAVYFALSEIYKIQKKNQLSFDNLTKAAELDLKNNWYSQELAYANLDKGDFSEAVINFDKFITAKTRSPELLYAFSEALARSGDTKRAISFFQKIESIVGPNPQITGRVFQIQASENKMDDAEKTLTNYLEKEPNDSEILALTLDFFKQTEQSEKGDGLLRKLVLKDPTNGAVQLMLFNKNVDAKKMDEAEKSLMAVISSPNLDEDNKVAALLEWKIINDKTPEKFDAPATKFSELYPNNKKGLNLIGEHYQEIGQDMNALATYKKLLEIDKSNFTVWNNTLMLARNLQQYDFLYLKGKECVELYPLLPASYGYQAIGAIHLKKFEEANSLLSAGREFIIRDIEMNARYLAIQGELAFLKKDLKEGKLKFEEAIVMDKRIQQYKIDYALQLINAKQFDKVESLLSETQTNNGLKEALSGWLAFQKEDFKTALILLESAYQKTPDHVFIIEKYADALSKNNKIAQAIPLWKSAIEFGSLNKNLQRKIDTKIYYEPLL